MTFRFVLSFGLMATGLAGQVAAQNPLVTTETQRYFTSVRRNLEASADAMPAEKYSFKLTDGQMSFGEWLTHSASRNFADCATLKGEKPPKTEADLTPLKDKASISQAVKDSFGYCAAVIEGLDDAKVLASPATVYSFLHIVVHNNEVYGNIVGYMRASGIVPPSTAGRGRQGR